MIQQLPDSTVHKLQDVPSDITSDAFLQQVTLLDQFYAFVNSINVAYGLTTVITSYFIITQVRAIKTIKSWQEMLAKFVIAIIWAAVWMYALHEEWFRMMISLIVTIVFYESIFTLVFNWLEKIGFVKLPGWYVQQKKEEKQKEITHLENAQEKQKEG